MADCFEVLGRVLSGRVVTAADVPAFLAHAQVHPIVPPCSETFDTTGSRRYDVVDLVEMLADFDHVDLLDGW
jgi:hypothetical protein